jgi:diguanylate cyclase (GGDEF)-like protein
MNGGNLSDTVLGPVISDHNILDAVKSLVPVSDWETMSSDFADEKEGGLSFVSGGLAETLCYVPVSETGWEMVVLIRESVIHDQILCISENNMMISRNLIICVLVAMLLFASVLLLELRKISRSRLEEEQEKSNSFKSMANTDSLTGIRNKHAFSDAEAALNHKIKEKEIDKLAIVVCDINGLKYVNDTQGHAAGDKLIIAACKVICEFFTHGAVYRIGGDEFAVILQGRGYDEMDGVIRGMNRQMEENIKTGDVVVSLGYSTMKDNDEELHDMFERADQMMYERKKELKAMGARTRE